MNRARSTIGVLVLLFLGPIAGCNSPPAPGQEVTAGRAQALTTECIRDAGAAPDTASTPDASATDAIFLFDARPLSPPLDARAIPQFVTQLPILPTYEPTVVRDSTGRIIHRDYNVRVEKVTEQVLPPGFPPTLVFGYGGRARLPDGTVTDVLQSPGPKFEQIRGIEARITFNNNLQGQHPLAVDPTLDWANPNNFPKPTRPFIPFPPGYPEAQSPITHVTHSHGLEVRPEFDGTPDLWFTPGLTRVGPEFVSNTYRQPSSNQPTAFWYHDHSFGVTRLDVGMGLNGFSILRDPNNPLDPPLGGNSSILGMEDPLEWKGVVGTITPTYSTMKTEGQSSVALAARGYVMIQGQPSELTGALSSPMSMDFFLPTQQPNPYWFGAVQLYVNCPSKNVNRAYVGQVELTGKNKGAWNRLSFPVPYSIGNSLSDSCSDFFLEIALNVPNNATGTYLVDNILGVPKMPQSILPHGEFEVPIIVNDRTFRTDGSVWYPTVGRNPDINPYWELIVDGNTIAVNGKTWPNLNVKRHAYRFRVLNAGNQRFYRFQLSNGMPMTMLGNDGGFLRTPMPTTSWIQGVTERVDVMIDFSQYPVGTKIILQNIEQHFPPIGNPPDPLTDGRVMQFTVVDSPVVPPKVLPATLANIPNLVPDRPKKTLIQNVQLDDNGRILQAELDGQLFHELTTELPTIGSTQEWEWVNTTPLDHNKHVHLVEFLLQERIPIDAARYRRDWVAINGEPPFDHPTIKLDITPYITGPAITTHEPWEAGWKDTIRTPAGMATRIRIRFAPQVIPDGVVPGQNLYTIDPTYGVGFVWHCHLVEHEDNEMMRPMGVIDIWRPGKAYGVGFYGNPGVLHDVVDFQGVDYASRVPHVDVSGQPPPTRFDLWQRINNENGDWAPQIIFNVGDRARFSDGHVYRALVQHQARAVNAPPNPAFWQLVL
jgi:FtsP/CotA-like multicopper oxidase with cupredoxin domain